MGKTREIFDLHFFARPGVLQANHCVVTEVEVPNSVLTCNMRNKFIIVSVYQAEFAVEISFMLEINNAHPGVVPFKLTNIHKVCKKYLL